VTYLERHHLLPVNQSGFRRGFSTETAIIKVVSDLLDAVDRGDDAMLALLDLSAAFDSVDHDILLERLRVSFGIYEKASCWFRTYLLDRRQHVRCGGSRSRIVNMACGVPQGSVLGPILFILYTADLSLVVESHGLSLHQYADDCQIYGSCRPSRTADLSALVTDCTSGIANWMQSNRLQLNADKTDVMWCASARRAPSLPSDPVIIAGADVQPVPTVRDLGVLIDSDLSAASHVRLIVGRCFAALRQLRQTVSDSSSRSSTQLHVWCSVFVVTITLPTHLPSCTGSAFKNVSTSSLRSWRINRCMVSHRRTSTYFAVSPINLVHVSCVRQSLIGSRFRVIA
jgi:hypothetical protein